MMSFLNYLPLVARNTPIWSLRQVQELLPDAEPILIGSDFYCIL